MIFYDLFDSNKAGVSTLDERDYQVFKTISYERTSGMIEFDHKNSEE